MNTQRSYHATPFSDYRDDDLVRFLRGIERELRDPNSLGTVVPLQGRMWSFDQLERECRRELDRREVAVSA